LIARALLRLDGAVIDGAIQRVAAATMGRIGEVAGVSVSQRPAATAILAEVLSRADDIRDPQPADWFGKTHVPTWILRYAHAQIGRMVIWMISIPVGAVLVVLGAWTGEWETIGALALLIAFITGLALFRVTDMQRSAIDAGVRDASQ
jgi:hypothetical protein